MTTSDRATVAFDRATFAAAAETIADVVHRTPVERSTTLGRVVGSPVYLKAENLQRTGSFKIRGAYAVSYTHLTLPTICSV